jgi:hypothetical protein
MQTPSGPVARHPVSGQGDTMTALHDLLLRMAGHAPDDVVAGARDRLAEGRPDVAAAMVASHAGFLAEADLELLTSLNPQIDGGLSSGAPQRDWEFAPAVPSPGAPALVAIDLTGDAGLLDDVDSAAARAAGDDPATVALWRAWRAPDDLNPDVARVFLLATTAAPDDRPGITARLHAALRAAGVADPQAEVFGPDTELPWYQRKARGRSALIWAATPAVPVTIARDFDSVHPVTGPAFDPDHPTLSAGDEASRVLEFLEGGDVLLATTALEQDIFDGSLGEVVGQTFRTDGTWIWTDTVAYYLRTYGLAPDPELLAHIRSTGYRRAAVDPVARHRALAELFRPVPAA